MSRLALLTAGVLVVLVGAFPAAASAASAVGPNAKGGNPGHGGGSGGSSICGSTGTSNCGLDVSYPQCGTTEPSPTAFMIVGVNDGLANDYNPCLSTELSWAWSSSGGTSQPLASLYVNTADPGNTYNGTPIADWPQSSIKADPYPACTTTTVAVGHGHHNTTYTVGANSDGCAWQYGYDMAQGDVSYLTSMSLSSPSGANSAATYPWWLDVETANSWQSDTTMNLADLEGMVAAFQAASVTTVGVYSTSVQWSSIIGTSLTTKSSVYGVPSWIPGATSYTGAKSNCSLPSFTGGSVTLTQWTGTLDSDYVCPSA